MPTPTPTPTTKTTGDIVAQLDEHQRLARAAGSRSLMYARAAAEIVELQAERDTLAALLDGVLADDPQAIRDAAAWLTTNRPEVEG